MFALMLTEHQRALECLAGVLFQCLTTHDRLLVSDIITEMAI